MEQQEWNKTNAQEDDKKGIVNIERSTEGKKNNDVPTDYIARVYSPLWATN